MNSRDDSMGRSKKSVWFASAGLVVLIALPTLWVFDKASLESIIFEKSTIDDMLNPSYMLSAPFFLISGHLRFPELLELVRAKLGLG